MLKTIYLVGCGAKKAPCVSFAKELYLGELFQKSRAFVEAKRASFVGDRWFILSAKWGLLHPDAAIRPYDETLNGKKDDQLKIWTLRVLTKLMGKYQPGDKFVILAGRNYRKYLVPELELQGCSVEIPLEGLGIGQQLAWLKKEIEKL